MRFHYWAGLAAGVYVATATAAPPNAATTNLENVVVTATRTPQAAADTLAATTVINRADIERSQAQSVAELLEKTPSLTISNSGGPGKTTSIHLRGTGSKQVLVLVDGVRFGSATTGAAAIQDIPVSQIKRIEVVRGPRSSLYGADAVGGVIQIFTRDGKGATGNGPTPYFSVTGGRYDTWKGQAGVSGSTKRAHYNLSLSGMTTNGFDAYNNANPEQPDHDGYDRVDGSLNAGYRFDNGWRINAHYMRAEGDNEFDTQFPGGAVQDDTVHEVYGLNLDAPLTDGWDTKLSLARSRDLATNHDADGQRDGRYDTHHTTVSWQNDLTLTADQSLMLGADYRKDEIASSVDYDETERGNGGLFGEYQGRFGANEISLAVRGDDNQAYGEHATGSVSYGYHLNNVYTLTASYGNAFRAPTFNDLYYPNSPISPWPAANPDLKAEKSRTGEIGLKAEPDWGRWAIHAYQTDIDDAITLDEHYTPYNLDSARIRGVEGEVTAYLGRWRIGASADWLDAKNRTSGDNHGNDLTYRPGYSASLDVDRDLFSRFSAGATAQLVGSRYTNAENTDELGGYALFGLRGEMRINEAWKVQAKLENLFDRDYQTNEYYNQPGRAFYLTVSYAPGQL